MERLGESHAPKLLMFHSSAALDINRSPLILSTDSQSPVKPMQNVNTHHIPGKCFLCLKPASTMKSRGHLLAFLSRGAVWLLCVVLPVVGLICTDKFLVNESLSFMVWLKGRKDWMFILALQTNVSAPKLDSTQFFVAKATFTIKKQKQKKYFTVDFSWLLSRMCSVILEKWLWNCEFYRGWGFISLSFKNHWLLDVNIQLWTSCLCITLLRDRVSIHTRVSHCRHMHPKICLDVGHDRI